MDNALDQHPGLNIVLGGVTNQLDVNELCQLTGWNSLVDFPTRGVSYLDNVLTNRPDLFGKCAPFSISIKTYHTAVILPAGSKLKPVRQKIRIRDCRKHRKEALYLELGGETWGVSWEQTMWMRLSITWKLLFTDTWISACHSEQFAFHHVIRLGWPPFSSPWWGLNRGLVKTGGIGFRRISEVISENRRTPSSTCRS